MSGSDLCYYNTRSFVIYLLDLDLLHCPAS